MALLDEETPMRKVRVRWADSRIGNEITVPDDKWLEEVCILEGEAATLPVDFVTVLDSLRKMIAIRNLGNVKDERHVLIDTVEPVCNCAPFGKCQYEMGLRFSIDPDSHYPNPAYDKLVWDSLLDREAGGYVASGTPENMRLLLTAIRRENQHQ